MPWRRPAIQFRPDGAARRKAPRQRRAAPSSSPVRCRHPLRMTSRLAELLRFFADPVRGFFRALDYTLPWDVDGVEDAMPVEINASRSGRRRPDAGRHLGGLTTDRPGSGVAHGHCRPVTWAGVRRSRFASRSSCWPPPHSSAGRPRRRPTTSTSNSAPADGSQARCRRSTATGWCRSGTASWTASTCWSRGFRCWRWSLTIPAESGGRSASAGRSAAPRRRERAGPARRRRR